MEILILSAAKTQFNSKVFFSDFLLLLNQTYNSY